MSKPFNVRVYGLLVVDEKLLVLKEPFMGELIYKFPGGGLEFGEGTVDCLKREFKEELSVDVEIIRHLYTQDFFMQSGLDPKEQILMIYYQVSAKNPDEIKKLDENIESLNWIAIDKFCIEDLTLSTDQFVVDLFLKNIFS